MAERERRETPGQDTEQQHEEERPQETSQLIMNIHVADNVIIEHNTVNHYHYYGNSGRLLKRASVVLNNVREMTLKRRPEQLQRPHTNRTNAGGDRQDEIYVYVVARQLDASSFSLQDHVANGKFAIIYRATWNHEGRKETVAVKMPKPGFTEDDARKMRAKIDFFTTQLEGHDNIIRFLGAVTDNTAWGPVMVMEFCENGQMDTWLAAHKDNVDQQLIDNLKMFSVSVAKGMEYMASKGITHRRLGARNVLLSAKLDVKVAGFGPQSSLDGDTQTREKIPAKWAAPEVLRNEPATEKSDVWSYGVVLWEIFSMGLPPYPEMYHSMVFAQLKGGYRMGKPELSDEIHYDLMKVCWQYQPGKRPTFKTIRARLESVEI